MAEVSRAPRFLNFSPDLQDTKIIPEFPKKKKHAEILFFHQRFHFIQLFF